MDAGFSLERARTNDELSLKIAKGKTFGCARGSAGAHVILKLNKDQDPQGCSLGCLSSRRPLFRTKE